MRFLVVDDEMLALQDLEDALRAVVPDAELLPYSIPSQARARAETLPIDVAFLDIELGSINGLILAKELKDLQPDIHIVFVTSYAQYAVSAFAIHATGYLLKPVRPEDIRRELTFLYGDTSVKKAVCVQTFGGFRVLVNGQSLKFGRMKTKELLAILVDRRGMEITTREACALLWEGALYDRARKNYFQILLSDLRATLREAGVEHILLHSRNRLAIDPEGLSCDSYRFLDGDPQAVNCYRHDYMSCYSWAEFTVGRMERILYE